MSVSNLQVQATFSITHIVVDLHFREQDSSFSAESPTDVSTAISGCPYPLLALLHSHRKHCLPSIPGQSLILGNTKFIHLSTNSYACAPRILHVRETGKPFRSPHLPSLCFALWTVGRTPVTDCNSIPATCRCDESSSAPFIKLCTVTSSILGMFRQLISCSINRSTSPGPRGPRFGLPL